MRTTYTVRNGITVNDEARVEDVVVVTTVVMLPMTPEAEGTAAVATVVLLPKTPEAEGIAADVPFKVAVSISVWVIVVSMMVLMIETKV